MKQRSKHQLAAAATIAYAAAIIGANQLTLRYGLVPVGFGLTATAGTYCAGCALMLRNQVQDLLGRTCVAVAILAGAALSSLTSPTLALASGIAFAIGELIDMALYSPLRRRGWARAVLAASLPGAAFDTVAFLDIAGIPMTGRSIAGQLIAKAWAVWVPVVSVAFFKSVRHDQVPHDPLDA
jgi:queuosine precursor transporter